MSVQPNGKRNTEIHELITELLNNSISEEQFHQLEEQLAKDPHLRDYYVDFLTVCAGLRKYYNISNVPFSPKDGDIPGAMQLVLEAIERDEKRRAEQEVEEARQQAKVLREEVKIKAEDTFERFKEQERRRQEKLAYKQYRARQRNLVLAVGSLVACLLLGLGLWVHNKLTSVPAEPPMVATITQVLDAQWADPEMAIAEGARLPAAPMYLKQGLAQITFDDGAEVVFQAPCRFTLENANRMFLESGNLVVVVPEQAHGFTVNTHGASIVDLGTEFGVSVEDGGSCSLYMFEGEANLIAGHKGQRRTSRIVNANKAVSIDVATGDVRDIKFDRGGFVRRMPSLYELAIRKTNPVVCWQIDESDSGQFYNYTATRQFDNGKYFGDVKFVSGPDFTYGQSGQAIKLDGKGGYAFVEDVVAMDVRTGSSSIAAWVRLDGKGGQNIVCTSLLSKPSWGHSQQLRADDEGGFEFYVYTKNRERCFIKSKVPARIGRWYHLVGVVNGDEMFFFVDGELVGTFKMPALPVDNYHNVNIGGWSGKKDTPKGHASEYLNGAIAEVSLYGRALSKQEVEAIYRAAKGSL